MPNITMRGWDGYSHQITSSDPDVIAAWLLEKARLYSSANSMLGPVSMNVYPLSMDGSTFDWPPGQQFQNYELTAKKIVSLAKLLTEWREKNEVRDSKVAGSEWCDYGNHAFKSGRKGTIRMAQEGDAEDKVICPECSALLGLGDAYEAPEPPSERKAAIEGRAKKL